MIAVRTGHLWFSTASRGLAQLSTSASVLTAGALCALAAMVGGSVWFLFAKALGGPEGEPSTAAKAIAWALTTNLPLVFLLILLNTRGRTLGISGLTRLPWSRQAVLLILYLLGVSVAACVFYVWSFGDVQGVRRLFAQIFPGEAAFLRRETWLVLTWSAMMSCGAFVPLAAAEVLFGRSFWPTLLIWTPLRVLVVIAPPSLLVIVFLVGLGDTWVDVRGILAGISLRTLLLLAALTAFLETRTLLGPTLGSGAFGTVYRAIDLDVPAIVAVKTLREPENEREARERQRELAIAQKLRHPQLPAYFSGSQEYGIDGRPLIRMEWINGRSIRDVVGGKRGSATCTPQSPMAVARWLRSCLEPLNHLHEHGVVHRDLHLGNVLLDESGSVILVDYGSARTTKVDTADHETVLLVGSPQHAAPEKWAGPSLVGTPSDYFSLGVMAYMLLTGRMPYWTTRSLIDLWEQIQSGQYERPSALRPDLPAWADTLIAGLLAVTPSDRPQYDELKNVLDGILRSEVSSQTDVASAG